MPELISGLKHPPSVPPLRLTRTLVDRLPPRVDERGPVMLEDPPPEFYHRTAAGILKRLDTQGAVWVFAAGSLIWNPRMEVAERRAAQVTGWRRAFCLTDRRLRGCPTTPGLMMSLDRGGASYGVVLRMTYLSPPVTMVVAWLVFGETLTLAGIIGLVIAAAAVALTLTAHRP